MSRIQPQGSHTGRNITSYRQLRVKDFPKVPTWRLKVEPNQRPSVPKALTTTTQPTTPLCNLRYSHMDTNHDILVKYLHLANTFCMKRSSKYTCIFRSNKTCLKRATTTTIRIYESNVSRLAIYTAKELLEALCLVSNSNRFFLGNTQQHISQMSGQSKRPISFWLFPKGR